MITTLPLKGEEERLAILRRYRVLDTPPEQALDSITEIAALVCEVPVALISLVDESRQWFKSRKGMDLTETPRSVSFCSHALHSEELFVVKDASVDPRFSCNPLVCGPQGYRFYTGMPLVTEDRAVLGTLCIMDHLPRELSSQQQRTLKMLGQQVVTQLDLHRKIRALLETADINSKIVDSSDDAIIGKNLNGIIHTWNQGAERIFGYTSAEMIGASILSIIPENRHPEEIAIISRIKSGKSVTHFETQRRTKDGKLIDVSVTASPIKDADGIVTGASKVARDISEQKKIQSSLEASEARLAAAQARAHLGSWEFDFVNQACIWSTEMSRLHWRDPKDGAPSLEEFYDSVHPDDREAVVKFNSTVRQTFKQVEMSYRTHPGLGPIRHLVATVHVLRDLEGKPLRLVGTALDVTERKKSENRLRCFLDSNVQGVLFWNVNGTISNANDSFLRMLDYTREDMEAGRLSWKALTPAEFYQADQQAMDEISRRGYCEPYEKQFIRKNGTPVSILIGGSVFDDDPTEGISFALDLTDRKKLEQQFLRAQRMESIGTLAGGIAHDLNNVLSPIMMAIELLKLQVTDPKGQEVLAIISGSAKRGGDMVKQVLSFARGVEGQRMDVQVRHLIQDIEKVASDTFLKNIEVVTHVPADLWTVLGDATQLHQVLLNLCVNARDAMPSGGLLSIRAKNIMLDEHYAVLNPEAHPGAYVFIEVEDNGTGIPAEIIEQIFDPFFTTKDIGKGTGLGLSTSLAIIKSHGGFIRVYSENGRGTTFKVYLPGQMEPSFDVDAETPVGLPRGNGELILVVDDEASVRQITQQTLDAFGYRVVLAVDGADAVALYAGRQSEIDLILTDMMMPVMDGPTTIQVLRKINPKIRIIAASGLSANGHVAQAAKLGVKHFLPKPYTAGTLLVALKEALEDRP